MLQSGSKLGDYEIVRTVGQGGMGAVYEALDAQGQHVAIKEMVVDIREPTERMKAIGLFASEAELLRRLDHPLLVDIHQTFDIDNHYYMVMDFVDGQTLAELLEQRRPAVAEVLDWADQVCEVLHYLHTREPVVIFRDLKPSNIMLDKTGRIRLIDFGIARVFEDETKTATFIKGVGSKGFAPIEQYGAGGTDVRTDVYSLGATLYNLLTGEKPPASISLLAATDKLEPLRKHNPEVPRRLEQIVLNMMALTKEHRYPTIAEVRELLARVVAGENKLDHTDQLTGPLGEDEWVALGLEPTSGPLEGPPSFGTRPTAQPPSRSKSGLAAGIVIAALAGALLYKVATPSAAVAPAVAPPTARPVANPAAANLEWIPLDSTKPWKYLDDGSDQKSAWKEPDFDDSKWSDGGPGRLGYGDPMYTNISFGKDAKKKHITSYFRKRFQISNRDRLVKRELRVRVMRDDGAVVYLNGKEIFRSNLPKGPLTYKTLAVNLVQGPDETKFFMAAVDPSLLRQGENVLAGEVHQQQQTSSDLAFNAFLESKNDKPGKPLTGP